MKNPFLVITITAAVAASVLAVAGLGANRLHQDMEHKMMDMRSASLKKAATTVDKSKKALTKTGNYSCCLKHSCDFCALRMGGCTCGPMASSDKPVCNECKGGWAAGDGAIPGKKDEDIKTMPRGMKM